MAQNADGGRAVRATKKKSSTNKTIVNFAGEWGSFKFRIKKSRIIGVKDLNISVSVETENKTADNENYTTRKNYNPAEITMTGIFSRALGVKDVKAKSWELMNIIRLGQKGYIYSGSEKLIAPMVMGTSAKTTRIEIGPDGKWWYCEVSITLKQCEKYGGGTSGSSSSSHSGSKRQSGRSGGTTTPKRSIYDQDPERKKQMEQAKQKAKESAQGGASASIQKKLGASGKTQRSTGGAGGTWRAQTQ